MIAHPDEHRKNKEAGRRITETEGGESRAGWEPRITADSMTGCSRHRYEC
jgi:hypothetical protein